MASDPGALLRKLGSFSRRVRAASLGDTRTETLHLRLRPWEMEVLTQLAKGWGVPRQAAGWALLASELHRLVRHPVDLGKPGAVVALRTLGRLIPPAELRRLADELEGLPPREGAG